MSRDRKLVIMKFGGTSLGGIRRDDGSVKITPTAAMRQVGQIVDRTMKEHSVVVVVSALSGVTDRLIYAARSAATGDDDTHRQIRKDLESKHRRVVENLILEEFRRTELLDRIGGGLDEFENLCHSIYVLGVLPPRGLDAVSSLGERLSCWILTALLNEQRMAAQEVEATKLILTDDNHGAANPLMDETRKRTRDSLLPLLKEDVTPVVTGFIGATFGGVVTTLGRGGSDYSASILGACLDADAIWIWTDVDGVMSADPQVVPDARTLPQLSYDEMAELAYFGAKVVHPKTTLPSAKQSIPLYIRNTFKPYPPGTLINDEHQVAKRRLKAITAISGLSLVFVEGRGMASIPDITARALTAIASTQTNVFMISQSSSQQNTFFVVPKNNVDLIQAIKEKLELDITRGNVERVSPYPEGVVIVAMVGAGMTDVHLVLRPALAALGRAGIDIIAIAQGASKYSISLVVSEHDADKAIRAIHREFRMGQTKKQEAWRPH